jgi:hypothetical protein
MLSVALPAPARELSVVPLDDRFGVAVNAAGIHGSGEGSVTALALPLDGGVGRRDGPVHEDPLPSEK